MASWSLQLLPVYTGFLVKVYQQFICSSMCWCILLTFPTVMVVGSSSLSRGQMLPLLPNTSLLDSALAFLHHGSIQPQELMLTFRLHQQTPGLPFIVCSAVCGDLVLCPVFLSNRTLVQAKASTMLSTIPSGMGLMMSPMRQYSSR